MASYTLRGAAIDRDQTVIERGDPAAAMAGAAKKLSATYFWPNQSHASLGPSCAVADVRADEATIWSASQGTHGLRTNLATVFGLPVDKVRVVFAEGSGSYGTNGNDDVAADAVLLSKTLGQPVRVPWTRQDEHRWDPKGPQQLIDVQAALDTAGRIVAWDLQMWVPTTRTGARAARGRERGHRPAERPERRLADAKRRSALRLLGAGEAASAPVAGALANAIFDATGVRLRRVPFTAERVKMALSGRSI